MHTQLKNVETCWDYILYKYITPSILQRTFCRNFQCPFLLSVSFRFLCFFGGPHGIPWHPTICKDLLPPEVSSHCHHLGKCPASPHCPVSPVSHDVSWCLMSLWHVSTMFPACFLSRSFSALICLVQSTFSVESSQNPFFRIILYFQR